MTNKEKYQRTFSALHASGDILMEVKTMKSNHRVYINKLIAVCAAAVMILALASVAYAADVGGIRRTVQIWLHGDQTDAVMVTGTSEDGTMGQYTLTYTDENGVEHERGGGGVAIEGDGTQRPLTAEEMMEEVESGSPEVEYKDDGTVWLYCRDQKIELTNLFDADGFCYITVMENGRPLYVTVKYQDGWCTQSDCYATPADFRN
jgi:hypothetical protein